MTRARLRRHRRLWPPGRWRTAMPLRDLPQGSWASEVILSDTCPDRGSGWSFRRSGRYGRRSVKPLADPTLVRTRHLPLLLARGSRRDQDPRPQQRRGSSPVGAAQPVHRCPSRDTWLHPAEGMQHSEARPVPTARTAGSGCPQPAGQSSSARTERRVGARSPTFPVTQRHAVNRRNRGAGLQTGPVRLDCRTPPSVAGRGACSSLRILRSLPACSRRERN
jgi:hypothetical protein